MRYIKILLTFLIFVSNAYAGQSSPHEPTSCQTQAPYGWPQVQKPHTAFICRTSYAVLSDLDAKVAPWEVYTLTPDHAIGCVPRSNAFATDQSLPVGGRADVSDYLHAGYDMGHMVNDADQSWDVVVEHESFILSNMEPQLPSLNRGIWKELETLVRVWAWQTKHTLTIYVGGIYDVRTDRTIGQNRVVVPHAFYKIVIDDATKQSYAWIFPHKDGLGTDLAPYQVTVSDVEHQTGIQFPVPDSKTSKNVVPSVTFATFSQNKSATCHGG